MKIDDIKDKKVLLILKNYLKDSRIRKNIGCGVLALACLIATQVSSGKQDNFKENEGKELYVLINDLDLLHPYISFASREIQKTDGNMQMFVVPRGGSFDINGSDAPLTRASGFNVLTYAKVFCRFPSSTLYKVK